MSRLAAAWLATDRRGEGLTETSVIEHDSIDVFIGVYVGKGEHCGVVIDRAGKCLFDKALPNDEGKLRTLIDDLKDQGTLLFVVDQPSTIGALPIAVAQDADVLVGYLPGLAMRRIADLRAGEAKTDARDAAIIVELARSLLHVPGRASEVRRTQISRRDEAATHVMHVVDR